MKIISKFKDYYDGVSKFGYDSNFYFKREEREIENISKALTKINSTEYSIDFISENKNYLFHHINVIFCGKVYSGVKISIEQRTSPYSKTDIFIYDKESLQDYLLELNLEFLYENSSGRYKRNLTKLFNIDDVRPLTNGEEEYFIEHKIAIAYFIRNSYYKSMYFIANPKLKDLQFYKVLNANAAYQELEMYVSSMLPKEHKMPIEISDKDRVKQYGFDEWSFRKMPQQ